ncbi:MAG: hypothetical protein ACRERD_14890 [Candidatus Binatia bacterium]
MEAPLWLLFFYSSIGAVDGIYNHLYRYRLYAHASSLTEHLSHTLLGLGLTLTTAMLVFVEMGSLGFAFFLGIQALMLLNTLWDVSIEPKSRAPLGGFPPQEYFLHTVIFLVHGAFVWAVIANADQLVHGPGFGTLRWPPLPAFMLSNAVAFVIVGVGMLILHVYLLGVGYRAIKKVPDPSLAAEPSRP